MRRGLRMQRAASRSHLTCSVLHPRSGARCGRVKAGYLETPITGPTAVQIAIEAFISDTLGEL